MATDTPVTSRTNGHTLTVSGWAIDQGAPTGTGVDRVHVWAFPSGGGAGVLLGAADYGQSRPDVGSIFGSRFTNSGYRLQVTVAPGNYTIIAYMHSTVTGTFNICRIVRVTVR